MTGIYSRLIILFIIAQALGIFTASVLLKDVYSNPYAHLFLVDETPTTIPAPIYFFIYILVSSLVLIFIIRFLSKYNEILFRLLEFFIISVSSSVVFYSFFRVASFSYEVSMIAGIILALLIALFKFLHPDIKNVVAILSAAGVGVIFGLSFDVVSIIIFLVLLSFYDYFAVFRTKHMVELANFVMKENLAFTVTARQKPKTKEDRSRIDLGTGDIIGPIAMETTVFLFSPIASVFVFVGSVAALYFLTYLIHRKKLVLPALPPIVLGMLLFFAIGLLLKLY